LLPNKAFKGVAVQLKFLINRRSYDIKPSTERTLLTFLGGVKALIAAIFGFMGCQPILTHIET
jgi:hypothetical protein